MHLTLTRALIGHRSFFIKFFIFSRTNKFQAFSPTSCIRKWVELYANTKPHKAMVFFWSRTVNGLNLSKPTPSSAGPKSQAANSSKGKVTCIGQLRYSILKSIRFNQLN
ncbi:hypothetical protein S245_064506 [Arachis hypogaea]